MNKYNDFELLNSSMDTEGMEFLYVVAYLGPYCITGSRTHIDSTKLKLVEFPIVNRTKDGIIIFNNSLENKIDAITSSRLVEFRVKILEEDVVSTLARDAIDYDCNNINDINPMPLPRLYFIHKENAEGFINFCEMCKKHLTIYFFLYLLLVQ